LNSVVEKPAGTFPRQRRVLLRPCPVGRFYRERLPVSTTEH